MGENVDPRDMLRDNERIMLLVLVTSNPRGEMRTQAVGSHDLTTRLQAVLGAMAALGECAGKVEDELIESFNLLGARGRRELNEAMQRVDDTSWV